MEAMAVQAAQQVGAGHFFAIFLNNAYPINVLNAIKNVPEVCRVFCATANPVQVLVVETEQGRGVVGVVDGFSPRGVEDEEQAAERVNLLRTIGYKLG
jgi:adenosine/AMP kinase